ncbi:cupin domain-containing protein [Kineosporia sp. NBRC 101731]|uniref:JmjC domain-containing protein n=1 Tax=Kineosporia sp. NBRC 101731 TaxID=3032199 RepID=UPI0024A1BAAD|nr:cupin domain-containing protein [Kineosporia sp. NBRC 101731]GLY29781.1 hypothetical protein Kisp02_31460 [Kineosporia sp. NBRC 101731]
MQQGLNRLVNDVQVLTRAWERETVVSTGLGDFDDVLSVASVEALIEGSLPLAAARLFKEGEFLSSDLLTRPAGRRGRNARQLVHAPALYREVRAGATVAIEELQLFSPGVEALTSAVSAQTGYDVDSTAFLTPARAGGAGPHRDKVGFFLRQVHGVKRWRVWPAETGPADQRPDPLEFARTPPEIDILLKEGDCIYIPRGRMHVGETLDEPSLHLSIGMFQITWAKALANLAQAVGTGIDELAEFLPSRFATVDPDEAMQERLGLLIERLGAARWSSIDPGNPARAKASLPSPAGLQEALDRYRA